jgi:hypothetical protein
MLKLNLIYERQSVGQSVLVSGAHLGPATNFSSSLKFSLDGCGFVAPSLTRGRVSVTYFTIVSGPCQSSHSWSESRRVTAIFYCLICDSPKLEGQVPVFISPRNRVTQLYPRTLGSLFVAPYDSQGWQNNRIYLGYGRGWVSLLLQFHYSVRPLKKLNSVARVRERPSLVSEVSANFTD